MIILSVMIIFSKHWFKRSFSIVFFLLFSWNSFAHNKQIIDLRTNYETTPLALEGSIVFSWKMDAGNQYKARQRAYRLLMAESAENLSKKRYLYDSQKKVSDNSVCIYYNGKPLGPCKRYYWKVQVWDEKGKMTESTPTWFETSLMNSGWDGAQWIGSSKEVLSKYIVDVIMEFDAKISCGSHVAPFIFGARNSHNYCGVELTLKENLIDTKKKLVKNETANMHKSISFTPEIVFFHMSDSSGRVIDKTIDISNIISKETLNTKHHIKLTNFPEGISNYELSLEVDGQKVKFSDKKDYITITEKTWTNQCRLYSIGYEQPKGENAAISNISIYDKRYGTLLYKNKNQYILNGSGKINIWQPGKGVSAPLLRKAFSVSGLIKNARLYATARGIYEMFINGQNVSKDFLNPGWTDYRKRIMYNTYDVTPLVKKGDNVIGATLGQGWWQGGRFENPKWYSPYGVSLSLLSKLVIEFVDGTKQIIVTDGSWLISNKGPIIANDLYNGEDYDARQEITNWAKTNFDEKGWDKVKILEAPQNDIKITSYVGQPVRMEQVLTAKSVTEPLKGTYIYDMGQNMVGVPHITIKGKVGQKITFQYGEMKYPDTIPTEPVSPYTIEEYEKKKGQLYTDNYRTAISTDHYICKGDTAGETFEPHFTCHGFRYIQIKGINTPLALENVQALVINSLQDSQTCSYATSDKLVNQLFSNIQWGEKSNFITIPTDCPQRDERAGWMGDAQIFCRTATYNRNVAPFYHRWLNTVRDDQMDNGNFRDVCPDISLGGHFGWADAGIIVPWQVYQQYGDKTILEASYKSMKHYIEYIEKNAKNFIQPFGGYGDWVAVVGTQSDLTNTCYAGYDIQIMIKVAEILEKTTDKIHFEELLTNIKTAFNKRFIDSNGHVITPIGSPLTVSPYGTASKEKATLPTSIKTQTAYVVPLFMNMIADSIKYKSIIYLVDLIKENGYKLNTGFIGTPYLNMVLSAYGFDDIAYKLIQQKSFPSWLYPVLQGATTMWERWNSYTIKNGFGPVSMNSFNHYAYGAIQDWLIAYSAGIERDEECPGYKHFFLQPRIGGRIEYVNASFKTMYGLIKSQWKCTKRNIAKDENAANFGYIYSATVPANSTATMILPISSKRLTILKGKNGIQRIKKTPFGMVLELTSGSYKFQINK